MGVSLKAMCAAVLTCSLGVSATSAEAADREALFQQTLARPGDSDLTFAYVRASIDDGDTEAAIGALERILFHNPKLTRARFELGSLYHRLGSHEIAARHFRDALAAPDLDAHLRARAAHFLDSSEKNSKSSRWFGLLQTGWRSQSNAGAFSDGGVTRFMGVDLPAFGTVKKADTNVFGLAQIGHDYDLPWYGAVLESRLGAYQTIQSNMHEYNLGLLEGSIGPRIPVNLGWFPGTTIKPYVVGGTSWIHGTNFVTSGGAGLSARVPLSQNWMFEKGVEWRSMSVGDGARTYLPLLGTGQMVTLFYGSTYRFNDYVSFESKSLLTRMDTRLKWQSFTQNGYEAALRIEYHPPFDWIPRRWTAMPFARIAWTRFDDPDTMGIDPYRSRRDREWKAGLTLDTPLTNDFGIATVIQYAVRDSNISNYRTKNFSILTGPTARF